MDFCISKSWLLYLNYRFRALLCVIGMIIWSVKAQRQGDSNPFENPFLYFLQLLLEFNIWLNDEKEQAELQF